MYRVMMITCLTAFLGLVPIASLALEPNPNVQISADQQKSLYNRLKLWQLDVRYFSQLTQHEYVAIKLAVNSGDLPQDRKRAAKNQLRIAAERIEGK